MRYGSERTKKILKGLIDRSLRQIDLAREIGVSDSAVAAVIHGRIRSRRIEDALSRAIGVPVEELWPDRGNRHAA